MPKIYVYDAYSNKMITYNLGENDTMPYSYGTTMKVKEFRGSSQSPTLWTTVAAMEEYARGQGHELDFSQSRFHHEIYLSDARRCQPEKLKTVIRQPIKRQEKE